MEVGSLLSNYDDIKHYTAFVPIYPYNVTECWDTNAEFSHHGNCPITNIPRPCPKESRRFCMIVITALNFDVRPRSSFAGSERRLGEGSGPAPSQGQAPGTESAESLKHPLNSVWGYEIHTRNSQNDE